MILHVITYKIYVIHYYVTTRAHKEKYFKIIRKSHLTQITLITLRLCNNLHKGSVNTLYYFKNNTTLYCYIRYTIRY